VSRPPAPPPAPLPLLGTAQLHGAATQLVAYPFKRWGFGEDIGLRALLEIDALLGEERHTPFVDELVRRWCAGKGALTPADHVAPGVVLLEVASRHDDASVWRVARELAHLLTTFPICAGVSLHRTDLPDWSTTIWVDCMALDGPFLARYAQQSGERAWADAASDALISYAQALHDRSSGLFHHGFDAATGRSNQITWGRGNGWALHGLIDTLEVLPEANGARPQLITLTTTTLGAIARHQSTSGLWHTVITDPSTPLENSTAAFFASAILKALRLGIVSDPANGETPLLDSAQRALAALRHQVQANGGLAISSATPVGDRQVYAEQRTGVYPWGQGPLLLAHAETLRWAERSQAA
jgi:rhamnogalacturonyl hydrolase YesR